MQRWIALLRAINVGGHTVKMDALRGLFETLGFHRVETFIASGNVIFDAPDGDAGALEQHIEGHLQQSLGYPVATFLRTAPELAELAAYTPFPADDLTGDGHALYIAFLKAPIGDAAQSRLMELRTESDEFHFHRHELYWLRRNRISDSIFSGPLFERTLQAQATVRNATTVRKLAVKYSHTDY